MADKPELPKSIPIHFIKSSQFRVVWADGMHGGITPRGLLHMAFFNERSPLPRQTEVDVNPDGTAETGRGERTVDSRKGIVREIEVDVLMNLETAESFRDWLSGKIEQLKKMGSS